jgi:hypothetical protein
MEAKMEHPEPIDAERTRQLKASYFRLLDTKQWKWLRAVFTEDASFEGFSTSADNPDLFVANLVRNLTGKTSVHQGHTYELATVSDDLVRGIWSMSDYLAWPVDAAKYFGRSTPGQWGVRGYGYYEDEYRRTDAGWLISFSRLVRLRIDALVDSPPVTLRFLSCTPTPFWLEA